MVTKEGGGVSESVSWDLCENIREGAEKLCEEKHSNIDRRFEGIEIFMKEQSESIKQLNEAVIKLSSIADSMAQMMKFVMEERHAKETGTLEDQPKLWQQPWFKWPVLAGSIAVLLLILTAIGNQVMDSIPWVQKAYELYQSTPK